MILSRATFYVALQLGGYHWGVLRRRLSRVEWRTVLGGTLFATLADLVFVTDRVEWKDVVPVAAVQLCVVLMVAWRTIRQLAQVAAFREHIRDDADKHAKYDRILVYHWLNLAFLTTIASALIVAVILSVMGIVPPLTIIIYGQPGVLLFAFVFWFLCLSCGLLY